MKKHTKQPDIKMERIKTHPDRKIDAKLRIEERVGKRLGEIDCPHQPQ